MAESPDSEKQFDDSELLEMSQGDPAQARLLRKSLETLAAGHGGDALKEMAQEVEAALRERLLAPRKGEAAKGEATEA